MRENNAAKTGNAVIADPVLGPSGLSVETLHGTPRTGEEKVRTDGNKNRQRRAEMARPLDRWSVELQLLQLGMDFPHTSLGGFGQVSTTGPRQIKKLLYEVQGDESAIGHHGFSEDTHDLPHIVLSSLTPHALRGTAINLPVGGAIEQSPSAIGDSAAEVSLNVTQDGFIVVPLGDHGLGEEVASRHGARFGLIGSWVLINPDSAVSPEETPELCQPLLGLLSEYSSHASIHVFSISPF